MDICAGYFVHDFCVVIYLRNYYPQIGDFIVHHIVSIIAFTLCEKNKGKPRTRVGLKLAVSTWHKIQTKNEQLFSSEVISDFETIKKSF